MAIAKIRKLEIIALQDDKDKILTLLQRLGAIEIIDIREDNPVKISQAPDKDINLVELEEVIAYLAGFQEKVGLLRNMIKPKPLIYEQQAKEMLASFDYQRLLSEIAELRNRLKNITQHRDRLIQEGHSLVPWRKLKIPLDQIRYTNKCGILLGVLRTNDYNGLLEDCQRDGIDLFCEAINKGKTNTYLAIIYPKEAFERLEAALKNHHFNFVTLSHHKGTAEDRLLEINRELVILDDQVQEAKDKIALLSKERLRLMIVYDYFNNRRNRREIDKSIAQQKFTFALSGWIRYKDAGALEKELKNNFQDIAVFIAEPKNGEDIPVILENKKFIQPFEFITQIYGMPKYNELDPTPFLAPFFFLYFGLCVSDAGYGLVIILLCYLLLKKLHLGTQGVRFFRLFLLCGISTVIIGALTGSWFGNLVDVASQGNNALIPLKEFKDSLVLLDPLKEPTRLLGIALSLGIIQVWFGNIVAAIGNIKNKRYLDVLLDQATMLTLLFGLTGLGLIFLRLLDAKNIALFKSTALIGSAALIATQGRSEKGIGGKLFYGVFTLYNSLSGYLSDILSYSRLWALGLVTGVMANTINLISVEFSQIVISTMPFLNRIAFVKALISTIILTIIFVFGHAVSFFMNLLGAFVHPVRLQFVEFFSKFFKGGGDAFKPLKLESRYIKLGEATTYGTK